MIDDFDQYWLGLPVRKGMSVDLPVEVPYGDESDLMALVTHGEAEPLWPSDADLFNYRVTAPLTPEQEDWAARLEDPDGWLREREYREMTERIENWEEKKAADMRRLEVWMESQKKRWAREAAREARLLDLELEQERKRLEAEAAKQAREEARQRAKEDKVRRADEARAARRAARTAARMKKMPEYVLVIGGREYPMTHDEVMKSVSKPTIRQHLHEVKRR